MQKYSLELHDLESICLMVEQETRYGFHYFLDLLLFLLNSLNVFNALLYRLQCLYYIFDYVCLPRSICMQYYIYLKPRYLQKSWCEMLYLEYQLICKKTSVMWNKPRVSVFFEYDRDFL